MNYQTKQDIEFKNSNQWREIKFLRVDPFQNLTILMNLPLLTSSSFFATFSEKITNLKGSIVKSMISVKTPLSSICARILMQQTLSLISFDDCSEPTIVILTKVCTQSKNTKCICFDEILVNLITTAMHC